jgi:curved DNA-binding protein CbpA
MSPNLYEMLGLPARADNAAIKAAYRARAKQCHPDMNLGDAGAVRRFTEINQAYEILSNFEARAAYDSRLARRRASARARLRNEVAVGFATCVATASLAFIAISTILASRSPPREIAGIASQPNHKDRPATVLSYGSAEAGAWVRSDLPNSELPDRVAIVSPLLTLDGPVMPAAQAHADRPEVERNSSAQHRSPSYEFHEDAGRTSSQPLTQMAQSDPGPRAAAANATLPAPAQPAEDVILRSDQVGSALAVDAGETPAKTADEQRPPNAVSRATGAPMRPLGIRVNYQNAHAGFSLSYPGEVFKSASSDIEGRDRLLVSKNGRALLRIHSTPNRGAMSVAEYRQRLMAERYVGANFDDTGLHETWFVLSGSVGSELFFERITFSCDRQTIHGWLLVYPASEQSNYGAIIAQIESSYRFDHGSTARCGEAKAGRVRGKTRPGKFASVQDKYDVRLE